MKLRITEESDNHTQCNGSSMSPNRFIVTNSRCVVWWPENDLDIIGCRIRKCILYYGESLLVSSIFFFSSCPIPLALCQTKLILVNVCYYFSLSGVLGGYFKGRGNFIIPIIFIALFSITRRSNETNQQNCIAITIKGERWRSKMVAA